MINTANVSEIAYCLAGRERSAAHENESPHLRMIIKSVNVYTGVKKY
jgi:hypothetical protein